MSGTNYQRAETFSNRDNYGIAFILKEILRAILSTRDVLVGINKKLVMREQLLKLVSC